MTGEVAGVLVVGGTNFDIIMRADRLPEDHEKLRGGQCSALPGGSAANTAVGLAWHGLRPRLVSAVGDDALGHAAVEALRHAGVDTSLVRVDPDAATSMAVVLSTPGSKRMLTFPGADRERALDALDGFPFGSVRHVHVVGEPTDKLCGVVDRARAAGRSVSVEWNGRDMTQAGRNPETLNFMNADEVVRLPGAAHSPVTAAADLARRLTAHVVVTMGAAGAVWARPDGTTLTEPTTEVEPVDRTGGGDAFDAGVIAARLAGREPSACLRQGLDAAATVISKMGAHP